MSETAPLYKFNKTYPHYYKELPRHLTHIDVYRVLEMWNVTSPAIQHAIKKLLACGNRGYKDSTKDVNEAIVSLTRWIEMRDEETPPEPDFDFSNKLEHVEPDKPWPITRNITTEVNR